MKSPKLQFFIGSAMLALSLSACSESSSSSEPEVPKYTFDAAVVCPADGLNAYGEPNRGTFTDARDGQEYKYVTIGSQVWMAENLNYNDSLPRDMSWGWLSFCADSACSKGRLYVDTLALRVCPSGWHLPSEDEFLRLIDTVGGVDSAGLHLKATEGWIPLNPGISSNGTDDCGFALLPSPMVIKPMYRTTENDGYIGLLGFIYGFVKFTIENQGVIFHRALNDGAERARMMTPVRCVKD